MAWKNPKVTMLYSKFGVGGSKMKIYQRARSCWISN